MPHGVAPPAQFHFVPDRIRYASTTSPSLVKRIAEAPPPCPFSSLLQASTQPPSSVANVAAPSGSPCQTYSVPATSRPVCPSSRALKPGGSRRPFASAGPSGPKPETAAPAVAGSAESAPSRRHQRRAACRSPHEVPSSLPHAHDLLVIEMTAHPVMPRAAVVAHR